MLSSYRDFDGRRRSKHFLPRAKRKVRLAVARGWAVLSTSRVVSRRNEDEHPDWRHYRPALGWQGLSFPSAKTMTAAAQVSLEFRVESLELLGVESFK